MGNLLDRAAILSAADLKYEEVKVPEWGGVIRMRGMTGSERDAFEASTVAVRAAGKVASDAHIRATVVAFCAVDEQGNRLFGDVDIPGLGAKASGPLDRLYWVGMRLSRMTTDDIEELRGNLDAGPSAGSTSSSPENAG